MLDRTSINWTGPMPAVVTPFAADLSIDEEAFAANIDRMLAHGATGIIAAGCTGEFWALSMAERARLCALTVGAVAGRGPAIIGAGAIRPEEAIEVSHAAKEAGADAVQVMPPYFVELTRREMVSYFEQVDAGSALPVVLYNIHRRPGNAITPEIASELADLDKVVAIKESSSDWTNFHQTLLAVRDRIRVFCGPSSVYGVAATLSGADGLIDCFPNVWAPGCLDLWYATKAGRMDEAWALQQVGHELTSLFTSGARTLYPATKAAMETLGFSAGPPRPPLRPLDGAPLHELTQEVRRLLGGRADAAA